jgi:hypothetical protein
MINQFVWDKKTPVDIVLVSTPYFQAGDPPKRPLEYFNELFQLAEDCWIGLVDSDLSEAVVNAVHPPGENFDAIRQYGFPYAFIRNPAPIDPKNAYDFDPDARLLAAIALSRLVHPTFVGFHTAARILRLHGGDRQIVPYNQYHLNPYAFVVDPSAAWLIPSDVPAIRALFAAYLRQDAPNRIRAALWYFEVASRSYFLDVSWALLSTGLEALVRIRDERTVNGAKVGSTRAFVERLSQIGRLDSSLYVSEADLRDIYELRSSIIHGFIPAVADPRSRSLFELKQSLLRGILRKALLDRSFAAIFASDDNLQRALPIV